MSANDDHSHKTPIKTPKQLLIEVVLAFVVVVTVVLLLAMLAASGRIYDKDSPAMSAEEVGWGNSTRRRSRARGRCLRKAATSRCRRPT
jgi:hypothetical protein